MFKINKDMNNAFVQILSHHLFNLRVFNYMFVFLNFILTAFA